MAEQGRPTLKNYFRAGSRPTEREFGDLIDSMLHKQEEGFRKTPERGVMITAPIGYDTLMSFYRAVDTGTPRWSLQHAAFDTQLVIHPHHGDDEPPPAAGAAPAPPVLALHRDGRVGVNRADPAYALDVDGMLRSAGRIGSAGGAAVADEGWHDLTGDLEGCQALEVVASASLAGGGRHALVHALALNTFDPAPRSRGLFGLFGLLEWLFPRRTISLRQAYFGQRCDRLALRWSSQPGPGRRYRLQIRSRCDYGPDADGKPVPIRSAITRLWDSATPTGGRMR